MFAVIDSAQALSLLTVDSPTERNGNGKPECWEKQRLESVNLWCALENSLQECNMRVICSEWAKTCRNTGLILHRRGQTEQLLWQHRGWQTFESPPDAVCLLWCSCYCTLVALQSIAGWCPSCFVAAHHIVILCYSCMYGDMALLPFLPPAPRPFSLPVSPPP